MECIYDALSMALRTTSTTPSLSTLPDALLHEVIEFLAPLEPTDLLPSPEYSRMIASSSASSYHRPLNMVCRRWRYAMTSRVVQYSQVSRTLVFPSSVLTEGVKIRCMTIVMRLVDRNGDSTIARAEASDPATWDAVFKRMPNLVRLRVLSTPVAVAPVLASASRHCPRLRFLEFVGEQYRLLEDSAAMEVTIPALCAALPKWHRANGGLRALSIPRWVTMQSDNLTQLFKDITAYCPQIQRLRLTPRIRSIMPSGRSPAHPLPILPLDVWARFCETSSRLREISWEFIPVSKPYVDHFFAYTRPNLEELWVQSPEVELVMRMIEASPKLKSAEIVLRDDMLAVATSATDMVIHHLVAHCKYLETCVFIDVSPGAMEVLIRQEKLRDFLVSCPEVAATNLVQIVRTACVAGRRNITIMTPRCRLSTIYQLLRVLERETIDNFSNKQLVLNIHRRSLFMDDSHDECPENLHDIVQAVNTKFAGSGSYVHLTVSSQWTQEESNDSVADFVLVLNLRRKAYGLAEPGMFWVGDDAPRAAAP